MGSIAEPVPVEPGFVCRSWWIITEPFRLLIRFADERGPVTTSWRVWASVWRVAGHVVVGSFWWASTVAVWLVGGLWWAVPLWLASLAVEVGVIRNRMGLADAHVLDMWRLGWKFHRQWPRVWSDCAAKTKRVQSPDGAKRGESRASVLRQVVDHPRMLQRFHVRGPVVTYRVGVAPGRTFVEFEQVAAAVSANTPWVAAVELEFGTDRSSFGLLHVQMADVLAVPRHPAWPIEDVVSS